ncbi:MAG: Sigma factor SigB regulation protein RsbQ [Syntrophaceae bacterium PtaB.Bin038]|jgi:pimeloyl-ACP methyl ester carboxylesterase|nr:MAG: Sigma factor SigB regulation protein RsbQ [Syntrophaceae bacterium PtaB.Bin038]
MIRKVMIDGTPIACRVNDGGFVEGRKGIVFVHGSGGNHSLWEGQYGGLQREFNVAGLDLPGHGLSGGAGERDVMRYVQWVKKTIGALGLRGPVLVGHSLGAAISLNFAIREGYLLSAIVPVGGGVKMPVNPAILEKIHTDLPSVISMVVKFAISRPNRDAVGPWLQEELEKGNPDILHGDLFACDRMDIASEVASIAIPALVVCGDDDKMTPPDLSRFIAGAIPGARLALIEGAGHYVMREKPEEFNRVLAEFVRSLA